MIGKPKNTFLNATPNRIESVDLLQLEILWNFFLYESMIFLHVTCPFLIFFSISENSMSHRKKRNVFFISFETMAIISDYIWECQFASGAHSHTHTRYCVIWHWWCLFTPYFHVVSLCIRTTSERERENGMNLWSFAVGFHISFMRNNGRYYDIIYVFGMVLQSKEMSWMRRPWHLFSLSFKKIFVSWYYWFINMCIELEQYSNKMKQKINDTKGYHTERVSESKRAE